jgi:hypothetical protein
LIPKSKIPPKSGGALCHLFDSADDEINFQHVGPSWVKTGDFTTAGGFKEPDKNVAIASLIARSV